MSKCVKLELPADLPIEPCAIGEPIDWTKLQVLATYEDNTQATIPVTPRMLNESSLQTTASVRKSIIVHEGQRIPILIPIKNISLTGIQAETAGELVYREGEKFNQGQAKVTAFYSDGSSREVGHYKITPNRPLEPSITELTIRYGRCTAALPIKVLADSEAASVSAASKPEPQGVASVNEPEVVMDVVSGAKQGNSTEPKLDVGARPGVSAELKSEPMLLPEAPPGEGGDLDQKPVPVSGPLPEDSPGVEAKLEPEPPSEPTLPPANPLNLVTPSQQPPAAPESTPTHTTAWNIPRVNTPSGGLSGASEGLSKERVLNVVSIAQMPHKLKYTVGETEANLSGGRLNLIYADGVIEQVDMSADGAINLACSISGHGCIAFTYKGKPVTYPIQVVAPVVAVGIELARMPYKAIYEQDSLEIDMDGAELEVRLSNGGSETVPVTPDMIGPFSFADTGKSNILIMHKGFSVLCPVIVVPKGSNIPSSSHSAAPMSPHRQYPVPLVPPAPSVVEELVPPPAPEPAPTEMPKEEAPCPAPEERKKVDDIKGPEGEGGDVAEKEVGVPPKPMKDVPNFYVSTFVGGYRFPVELA